MFTTAAAIPVHDHDADYAALLALVQREFASRVSGNRPLFCTDAGVGDALFPAFLRNLPDEQQVHTCHTCRHFFERFGGLAVIAEKTGALDAAIWPRPELAPAFYRDTLKVLRGKVQHASVTGPYLPTARVLGTPETGPWRHLSVATPEGLLYRGKVLDAGQAMAAKREDFKTVDRALAEFPAELLADALRVLEFDQVNRAERFVGPVKWLLELPNGGVTVVWGEPGRMAGIATIVRDPFNWSRLTIVEPAT